MPEYDFTIIVPVYNEEENLPQLYMELNEYMEQCPLASKVLFVNDGSIDNSQLLLENFCRDNRSYHCLTLDKNAGLSTAIKAGIDECDTLYLGYIDSDLQTTASDFLDFIPHLPAYDMVSGIRINRNDGLIKRISSRVANSFRRLMINDQIRDTCCPLKMMKTSMAKQMPFFNGMHRFMPALFQLQGGKIKEIPVRHFPRNAGKAKYHLFNRLFKPLLDTLVFMWIKKSYIRYRVLNRI